MDKFDPLEAYFLFMTEYHRRCITEKQKSIYARDTLAEFCRIHSVPECLKKRVVPIVNHHIAQSMRRGM